MDNPLPLLSPPAPKTDSSRRLPATSVEGVGGVKHQERPLNIFKTAEVHVQPPCDSTDCLVKPLELVIHNQSTECFVILLCHNTFAKSYDSKVGLISQKRCILVTDFVVLLLPFLLHCRYHFCCVSRCRLQQRMK